MRSTASNETRFGAYERIALAGMTVRIVSAPDCASLITQEFEAVAARHRFPDVDTATARVLNIVASAHAAPAPKVTSNNILDLCEPTLHAFEETVVAVASGTTASHDHTCDSFGGCGSQEPQEQQAAVENEEVADATSTPAAADAAADLLSGSASAVDGAEAVGSTVAAAAAEAGPAVDGNVLQVNISDSLTKEPDCVRSGEDRATPLLRLTASFDAVTGETPLVSNGTEQEPQPEGESLDASFSALRPAEVDDDLVPSRLLEALDDSREFGLFERQTCSASWDPESLEVGAEDGSSSFGWSLGSTEGRLFIDHFESSISVTSGAETSEMQIAVSSQTSSETRSVPEL